jgi:hypothetical protein
MTLSTSGFSREISPGSEFNSVLVAIYFYLRADNWLDNS